VVEDLASALAKHEHITEIRRYEQPPPPGVGRAKALAGGERLELFRFAVLPHELVQRVAKTAGCHALACDRRCELPGKGNILRQFKHR